MMIRINKNWQNVEAFFLALTPFFRNYRIPYININLATFFFVIFFLINFILRIFFKQQCFPDLRKCVALPVIIYMTIYMIVEYYLVDIVKIGNISPAGNLYSLILYVCEIWILFFLASDDMVRENFKKHIVRITLFMSFVIYVQYILYYIFEIVLNKTVFIPFSGLYEPLVADAVNTSMIYDGLFRPSAFFLEPSHYAAYGVVALGVVLLEEKKLFSKKGILITIAIFLSTSGLGIAACLLFWGIKSFISLSSLNKKRVANVFIVCLIALLLIIILYIFVSTFRRSVDRVLINDDKNAIKGRLWTAEFVSRLTENNIYWGAGFKNRPVSEYSNLMYYMTGLIEILYCQGLIGTILFEVGLMIGIYRMWKCRNILNFSIMVLFMIWIVFGNAIWPHYLVKYVFFTFYENPQLIYEKSKKP